MWRESRTFRRRRRSDSVDDRVVQNIPSSKERILPANVRSRAHVIPDSLSAEEYLHGLPRRSYSPRVVLHRAVTWFLCYLIAIAIAAAWSSYLQVVDFAMDADISTSAPVQSPPPLPPALPVPRRYPPPLPFVLFAPFPLRLDVVLLRRIATTSCIGMADQFTAADPHLFIDCR